MQALRPHCGMLVLITGIFLLSQNWWGARRMRQSLKTDAPEHVTAVRCSRARRGVPTDNRIRYLTSTWHHHHTRAISKGSSGDDEHALPDRAYLAPAPSQAAAHLVIIQKENQVHTLSTPTKTSKFFNPTRNKKTGSRNMKTCRCRAGGSLHLRVAIHRVRILTVFSGEDTMQQTALLFAQERLLAGDVQQFRLKSRPEIRETTKLRFHAVQVQLQRRGGRRHLLRVRLRSWHQGASEGRRSSHGDGGCRGLGRE